MRALGLLGSLAIGCLVTLGTSCGSDDDNKGDGGGTGGSGSTGGTGGGSPTGGTGGSSGAARRRSPATTSRPALHYCGTYDATNIPSPAPVIQAWQRACTQGMGMSVTACPTSGAIGKCTFTSSSGGYTVAQTIYYYAPVTARPACSCAWATAPAASPPPGPRCSVGLATRLQDQHSVAAHCNDRRVSSKPFERDVHFGRVLGVEALHLGLQPAAMERNDTPSRTLELAASNSAASDSGVGSSPPEIPCLLHCETSLVAALLRAPTGTCSGVVQARWMSPMIPLSRGRNATNASPFGRRPGGYPPPRSTVLPQWSDDRRAQTLPRHRSFDRDNLARSVHSSRRWPRRSTQARVGDLLSRDLQQIER